MECRKEGITTLAKQRQSLKKIRLMEQEMPLPISLAFRVPLMFLGTVKLHRSREEKENGLLITADDANESIFQNQRLFWITTREYFMFLLPPLLFHCVIVGKIPWLNVLHLYLVFFSSVILYHLTAHVIGLVVPRPRAASASRIQFLVSMFFYQVWSSRSIFPFLSYHTTHLFWKDPSQSSLLGKQTLADLRQKRLISGRMYLL